MKILKQSNSSSISNLSQLYVTQQWKEFRCIFVDVQKASKTEMHTMSENPNS